MKRVETIKVLLRILDQKEKDLDTLQKSIEGLRIAIQEVENAADNMVTMPQKGTYKEEITSAMREIIAQHGPLHRNVILEQLHERGVHVGGGIRTVGSYLSVDDQFRNIGRGIWALTETFFNIDILSDKDDPESLPHINQWSSNGHCAQLTGSVVEVQ